MIEIATVGWLTTDDIVLADGTCRFAVPGGGALYSAVGAAFWSGGVAIHSVAGRPHHESACREIAARGIDTAGIGRIEGNGLELWLLHESDTAKQQVPKLSSSRPADLDTGRGALPEAYRGARGFHVAPQGPDSSLRNASQLAGLPGRPIVTMDILSDRFIDAGLYRDLSFLDSVAAFLPSEAEIRQIWQPGSIEDFLRANARARRCHMVAKLGERGALACEATSGALIHIPAFATNAADTTGAGDAFCGGFLAGLVAGRPLAEAAAMGAVSASYVVEASGALATPRPAPDDLMRRLAVVAASTRPVS